MTETCRAIPMPGLLNDEHAANSDHDPATSHEHGPISDRPVRDPSQALIDDPVTVYARQLWTVVDRLARYLRDDVARASGSQLRSGTSLLATDEQWERWREHYATALSVLAGPAGDQGYGRQEATLEYQNSSVSR
jgi:hypothetical protein